MTTVTVYRSTDGSAPSLTGQAGALITVLDAVLVNGYGSQPAAGWAKSFSATNKAAYRNSAIDGTGFYLNVDDTGSGNTVKEAFMTGFETMSAISTGTGQFPTSGQLNLGSSPAGALVCRKSTTADATARAWTAVADDTVFYLFTETGDFTSPTLAFSFVFGDIFSYKSSDAYRAIIVGRNTANTNSQASENFSGLLSALITAFLNATIAGHYMPRSWTGVGGSILVAKHIDQLKAGVTTGGAASGTTGSGTLSSGSNAAVGSNFLAPNFFPYPNGPDGGLYLSPIWIHHTNAVRGYFKGLWAPLHHLPLNHNDTYSGTGNLSGKSFVVQTILAATNATASPGQVHIETSSTWS